MFLDNQQLVTFIESFLIMKYKKMISKVAYF